MTLLGSVVEQTSFLFFSKTGSNTLFGLIARAMCVSILFLSGSLQFSKTIEGNSLLIVHDGTTNRYRVSSIRRFCPHPNIQKK